MNSSISLATSLVFTGYKAAVEHLSNLQLTVIADEIPAATNGINSRLVGKRERIR